MSLYKIELKYANFCKNRWLKSFGIITIKKTNIYSVLEELLIYNEVKRYGFNNILNVQADFKKNDIY